MDVPPLLTDRYPGVTPQSQRFASSNPWNQAARLLTVCFLLGVVALCWHQLFGAASWLSLEEDDFFYYLKVAANFTHGRGSTFGGITTNGYHPLWFLCLAAFSYLPNAGAELPVRIFLAAAMVLSTFSTYVLARRILQDYTGNPLLTNALAMVSAIYALRLFRGGMEVILTIPFIFLAAVLFQRPLLWSKVSFLQSLGIGLLCSAIFLSRLDSALLLCLLALSIFLHPRLRLALQPITFLLGLLPAFIYFVLNRIYFHDWMPVSGSAKQLKTNHMPSWRPWASISHANLVFLAVILIAIAVLPRIYARLTAPQQVLYPVLLLFPFIHLFVISCLSDWRLWPWYLYGARPALCISFAVLLQWPPTGAVLKKPPVAIAITLAAFLMMFNERPQPSGTYTLAKEIRQFSETHPGTYAMGDNAGLVSYLLPYPLIQMEGLMMDRDYLTLVRSRAPLLDALARYRVDYYIVTNSNVPFDRCFRVFEPAQAGPASPQMTANFCTPPAADFNPGGKHTFIFHVPTQK